MGGWNHSKIGIQDASEHHENNSSSKFTWCPAACFTKKGLGPCTGTNTCMESTNINKMQNPEIMHWLNWVNSELSELHGANAKQRPWTWQTHYQTWDKERRHWRWHSVLTMTRKHESNMLPTCFCKMKRTTGESREPGRSMAKWLRTSSYNSLMFLQTWYLFNLQLFIAYIFCKLRWSINTPIRFSAYEYKLHAWNLNGLQT